MTGLTFHPDFSGMGPAQAALAELARRTDDMSPAMREIGSALLSDFQDNFEGQHDPEGKPWRPLSEMTVIGRIGGVKKTYTKKMRFTARAKRLMGDLKMLQASHRLELSLTYQASKDAVEAGTNVVYAAIHNFGGEAGRGHKIKIPARQFIGLNSSAPDRILGIVNRYLAGALA